MGPFQLRMLFTSDDVQIQAASQVLATHSGRSLEESSDAIHNVIDGELRIFEFPDEPSAQACAEALGRLGLITKVTPKR
ncbi:MAG: hypothetical protein PVF51_09060 [Nitrospirota bacterium]|jgi:hypothetical protein